MKFTRAFVVGAEVVSRARVGPYASAGIAGPRVAGVRPAGHILRAHRPRAAHGPGTQLRATNFGPYGRCPSRCRSVGRSLLRQRRR